MTGYGIGIFYIDKTTKERLYASEDGLTFSQVQKIADQYQQGEGFLLDGKPIDPFDVEKIHIYDKGTIPFKIVTRDFITSVPKKTTKAIPKTDRGAKVSTPSKNIFIVHGRDTEPVKELKAMLEEFGLNPIVLHEQPSASRTIVEKLEEYSDVGYAFAILTPDDVGAVRSKFFERCPELFLKRPHKSMFDLKSRARQNVVFEFGYFMGKLGRDRVCCLYKGDVELPSDMHGIVYIPFKESIKECHEKIIKELKAVGYEIKI